MQDGLSLRERLLVVTAIALLPVLAIGLWGATRDSRAATAQAEAQLKFSASLLASNQERIVDAAEQLLGAIAAVPDLPTNDAAHCRAYFDSLKQRYAEYTNIALFTPGGEPLCAANGLVGPSVADRDYFREVVAQRRFVVGDPVSGRVTGRAVLPFAAPVIRNGTVIAVVLAALDLAQASRKLGAVELPAGARVTVADHHGHILMQFPQGVALMQSSAHAELLEAARTMKPAVGVSTNAEGEKRLYAIAPTRAFGDQGFVVRVGLPTEAVSRDAWARAREELSALLVVIALALGAVWWIGGRMIVRPAKQILGTTRRIEQGRLDARVPLHANRIRGEFARIGAAFNLMADSLQMRQADLEAELVRSRSAYAVLDQVLNSMQEGLIAVRADGGFLMYNEAAARLLPLADAPVLPELWPGHFGFHHADRTTPYRAGDLPLVRSALGESGGPVQVFVRNALVPEGRLLLCSWRPMQGGNARGGLVMFTDVTELERLESEQAAHVARLEETQRKLIESQRIGRVGNWELDLRTGRLWWSNQVFELFGVAPDDFDGTLHAFEQCVHPEDRPRMKPARDQALRDAKLMDIEYRIVKPDGAVAWMHEIADTRRNEAGDPVWFGGVVQDVTQRKLHEQAIEASRGELQAYTQMLQRAAEAAQAITAQSTLDGTLREVVRQACTVLGTRHASLTLEGEKAPIAFSGGGDEPDDRTPSLAVPITNRRSETIGELRVAAKTEGVFTQREHYVAVELAHLASIAIENARLLAQVRELNAGLESRIAERTAQLAQQEQLFRTLTEQAPVVVWNTDPRGDATYLNRAWYELVGGEPSDWLKQGWFSRIHPDDQPEVRRNWLAARASLSPFTGTRRILAKDGSYHTTSYKAAPVLDDDGKVTSWVGIDADITELKAIESALRASNQELEAFSYSVSHDLRAPLGAISGFSRALQGKVQEVADDKSVHYLERIQAGVAKMESLIEALLQLSRVVRAQLEWHEVDLAAMARDTIETLQLQEPTRKVHVEMAPDLRVHGDARLLRVVLENLIGNAWKFTANTAEARIEIGREPGNIFFVRDNGVGFDMAYVDKLFTAFQRLHRDSEFPGTGIGLATVRRVVARHQGRVWAESALERGATFYFSLAETAPPSWLREQPSAPG